jgi:putative transposase
MVAPYARSEPLLAERACTAILIPVTNAIESLHSQLRKAVRVRGHFPSDEAASKLMFLVLREVNKNWTMPPREWNAARTQFAVIFGHRFVEE